MKINFQKINASSAGTPQYCGVSAKALKKYLPYIAGVFILLFIFIIIQHPAFAGVGGNIGSFLVGVLSWLFVAFINVMGNLLLLLINGLISVANYGDFMNAPIVEKGWVVIRDLGNIAIVFMLLAMSFSTLFKKGSYQYRDFLPKIIIAAILINFSKFITGLAISISQVFMMEFVNAFKTIAAGNIVYGFGIHDLLAFRESASGGAIGGGAGIDVNDWSILGAVVLGALMVGVAVVIVLSLLVMLLARILILWFLVMFSPVAFLGAILPSQISKYTSKWQETLTKWLIAGPMVAFMLWLSFAVITEMTDQKRIINLSLKSAVSKKEAGTNEWKAFASKVSGTQNLVDYLVTAGLLLGALLVASQTGVAGAKLAGDAFGKIKGFGEKALSRGQKIATSPLRGAKKMAGAGWRATNVPYIAGGAANWLKNTGAGKFVGLNKEYTADKVAMRTARWRAKMGDKSAMDEYQYRKDKAAEKEMEEGGVFRGGIGSINKELNGFLAGGGALSSKDHDKARVLFNRLASEGAVTQDQVTKFRNKRVPKNDKEKEAMLNYLDGLRNTQSKKDKLADNTFGVAWQEDPVSKKWELKDMTDTKFNKTAHMDKVASKFTASDFADKSVTEAFKDKSGNYIDIDKNPEMLKILEKLSSITNVKGITPEGRKKNMEILEGIIPQLIKVGKPVGQIQPYVDTLKNMHATDFDKGSGEAISINRGNYDGQGDSSKIRIKKTLNGINPNLQMPGGINW